MSGTRCRSCPADASCGCVGSSVTTRRSNRSDRATGSQPTSAAWKRTSCREVTCWRCLARCSRCDASTPRCESSHPRRMPCVTAPSSCCTRGRRRWAAASSCSTGTKSDQALKAGCSCTWTGRSRPRSTTGSCCESRARRSRSRAEASSTSLRANIPAMTRPCGIRSCAAPRATCFRRSCASTRAA